MKKLFLFAFALAAMAACSDDNDGYTPPVDKYTGGFYVYNEGSYGHTPASVNYYDGKTWALNIFQANNPGEKLGNTGTTAVYDDENMYLVSKEAPFLVKVGLSDFRMKGKLADDVLERTACSFALLDKNRGVLTTGQGAYVVTLEPLALAEEPFYAGRDLAGDVAVTGGYIFLLGDVNAGNAIMAFDASTLKRVDAPGLGAAKTGFAWAAGALWAGNGDKLVKINVSDLTSKEFALGDGVAVHYNSMAFTPTGLRASRSGDALYFVNAFSSWEGRDIYKYTIASESVSKFFSAPLIDGVQSSSYGSGVSVNPSTGDLCLVYATNYGSAASIFVVDGTTGALKTSFPYTDTQYWYPSMILFR